MVTKTDFLKKIAADPDADLPRLIYADWLEEQGDMRSEFIRVQVKLYNDEHFIGEPLDSSEKARLQKRERELIDEYGLQWRQQDQAELNEVIARGMQRDGVDPERFLSIRRPEDLPLYYDEGFTRGFPSNVIVGQLEGDTPENKSETLAKILSYTEDFSFANEGLNLQGRVFRHAPPSVRNENLRLLAQWKPLQSFHRLDVSEFSSYDEAFAALNEEGHPQLPHLREFRLGCSGFDNYLPRVRELLQWLNDKVPNLEHLNIPLRYPSYSVERTINESGVVSQLKALTTTYNQHGHYPISLRGQADSNPPEHLEDLTLNFSISLSPYLQELEQAPESVRGNLKRLGFGDSIVFYRSEGGEAPNLRGLAELELPELRRLDLSESYCRFTVGDEPVHRYAQEQLEAAARYIGEIRHMPKVEELDLSHDAIGISPYFLRMMQSWNNFPGLKQLNLSQNALSGFHDSISLIAEFNNFPELTRIDLTQNGFKTAKQVKPLADAIRDGRFEFIEDVAVGDHRHNESQIALDQAIAEWKRIIREREEAATPLPEVEVASQQRQGGANPGDNPQTPVWGLPV